MIDLHSHTNESDGTYTPAELVNAATDLQLEALAITDHDTFAGYRLAVPHAQRDGLRLLCGIEMSTKVFDPSRKTVHLLAYFLKADPAQAFLDWVTQMQAARRDRNRRLVSRLQSLGIDIQLEEVEALGRSMTGRPHFARLMISKGYVANSTEAFERYLDESAPGYVDREEPTLEEAIRRVKDGGGITSIAHPVRLGIRDHAREETFISRMRDHGLDAIEVFHSDHDAHDVIRYLSLGRKYGLKITGGSDFHGENKPAVKLGTGFNNRLQIPATLLDELLQ